MTRVPFGASLSLFLLSATLQHHLATSKKINPSIASRLQWSLYVDDLVISAASGDEALKIYQAGSTVIADAGMELRKWCLNSSELCDQFLADDVSLDNVSEHNPTSKVLGLLWDRSTDDVIVTAQNVELYVSAHPHTKRTILQALAYIFVPLGLIAPFHVRARRLF